MSTPELKTVKTGEVTVTYTIRQYGESFDWHTSNGDDSYQLFPSAEDAEYDVRSHLGD